MKIDVHTHLGKVLLQDSIITPEDLIKNMDKHGIDKSVILPLDATPECCAFTYSNEQVLEDCRKYPDRLIPFCKLDPRQLQNSPDADFSILLKVYKASGCKGVGELTANLYFDDPLYVNLFKHCGKAGMPVLFHLVGQLGGTYGLVDDIFLPRLEKVIKECSETIFIGHAMSFWAEISANLDEQSRNDYPAGPVEKPGRLPELLAGYPNLYGDISADSGYNALTRDPEYGYSFMEEFQDKLLFGTDYCHHDQEIPIVDYIDDALKNSKISKEAYEKITHLNAERILNL